MSYQCLTVTPVVMAIISETSTLLLDEDGRSYREGHRTADEAASFRL